MKQFLPFLIIAVSVCSGCSTIVNHGRLSGVDVRSDPSGAEIFVDGRSTGFLTPARIELEGGSAEHVIRIEKPDYGTFESTVSKEIDPWVWGNAPFAVFPIVAAAGFGIDAWCGQWYRVEPATLDVSLRASAPAAPAAAKRITVPAKPSLKESGRQAEQTPSSTLADMAEGGESRSATVVATETITAPISAGETGGSEEQKTRPELDDILQQILENE